MTKDTEMKDPLVHTNKYLHLPQEKNSKKQFVNIFLK